MVRCPSVPSASRTDWWFFGTGGNLAQHAGQTATSECTSPPSSRHTHTPCLTRPPHPEIAQWTTRSRWSDAYRCPSVEHCMVVWLMLAAAGGNLAQHADETAISDCTSPPSSRHTHTPGLTRLARPEIAKWTTRSKWSDANRCPSCPDSRCVVLLCYLAASFFFSGWSAEPCLKSSHSILKKEQWPKTGTPGGYAAKTGYPSGS